MGLRRNLEAHEILLQLHAALGAAAAARMAPVRNVVFMGMGEPADNLASVEAALRAMTHPFGFALAPAHICVSSVGPSPERIKALRGLPARLAWSVHAADDSLRKALVPTTAHPITALRDAWADALTGAASRGLMVEVTLIDGVNDGEEEASRLAELLRPLPGKTRVNLIPYNANAGLGAAGELFRPSTEEAVRRFQRRLLDEHGLICTRRVARGADESAACGQLATRERVARRRVGSGAHGGAGENRRA
jgi:23S rRNA (adenine2503-C2)-methyltransferase